MLQSETRKVDTKTSPVETSMDSAVKPNKSNNYNLHQYLLSGQAPPWSEGSYECSTSREAVVTKYSIFPGQQ